jgi:hypothetical protein
MASFRVHGSRSATAAAAEPSVRPTASAAPESFDADRGGAGADAAGLDLRAAVPLTLFADADFAVRDLAGRFGSVFFTALRVGACVCLALDVRFAI